MSFNVRMESETLREITPTLADGRYTVVSELKEGRLYLAEKAGKRFVLKTSDGTARGLEKLKREYELSIGLSHPGLAYVFTYEQQSPVGPCMVQEFVDGETLGAWLGHHPSAKERRRIVAELFSVTAYLHRKGIVHNDLKPENILIGRSGGAVKLLDFGFADDDTHLDKALGGTRSYASPELLAGRAVDARSDVYSLGLILRELFPGRYRCLVGRCLRQEPGSRFASAGEVEKAWKRRRLPMWMALALALGLALGGLLYAYIGPQIALSAAKAEVDAWYTEEIPAFRQALREATDRDQVNAAWLQFCERLSILNNDIPARTPEAIRPALRDYIISHYNDVFPAISEEMTARMSEL